MIFKAHLERMVQDITPTVFEGRADHREFRVNQIDPPRATPELLLDARHDYQAMWPTALAGQTDQR